MTTRRGDQRKKAPVHQNRHKFTHNKGSKKTKEIAASPIEGTCKKCSNILQWKKDYRKYKPLTQPKKCTICNQKRITRAYHVICSVCASQNKVCAKCNEPTQIVREFDADKIEQKEQEQVQRNLKLVNERTRRAYLRWVERGCPEEGQSDSENEDENENSGGQRIERVSGNEAGYEGNKLSKEEGDSDDGNEEVEKSDTNSYEGDKESFSDQDSNDEDELFLNSGLKISKENLEVLEIIHTTELTKQETVPTADTLQVPGALVQSEVIGTQAGLTENIKATPTQAKVDWTVSGFKFGQKVTS